MVGFFKRLVSVLALLAMTCSINAFGECGFNFEDADLNHDGKVDATDLVLLIKII